MKKILLLFLLCVTCATSCKKDDKSISDVVVFTGDFVTVTTQANLTDSTVSALDAAIQTAFGADYRLSQVPLRIKVEGTITSVDFESLNYFDEIDLSDAEIVGSVLVGSVVAEYGVGASVKETWVDGDAIPMSAFINNTKLTRITLGSGVPIDSNDKVADGFKPTTIIGVSSFSGCTSLEAVNGLDAVTTVGAAAFKNCTRLGTDSTVDFKAPLTSIGVDAFNGCEALFEIDLSLATKGLDIGEGAFENCSSLQTAVLPDNLASLGMDLFAGCSSLSEITAYMGASTAIADEDELVIPKLATGVIPDQFKANASSAKIVYIEDVAMTAYSNAGGWSEYNLQTRELNGWKIVYNEANETDTTANTLDTSLKAMYGVNYAKEGDLKVKVTGTINAADFPSLCTGFESVDLSDVTVVGDIVVGSQYAGTRAVESSKVTGNAIPSGIFSGSKSDIKNFSIPKSATVIGDSAFEGNDELFSVTLTTDSPLKIGAAAFRAVESLGKKGFFSNDDLDGTLVIAGNVGEIGDFAFDDCNNVTAIELRGETFSPIIGEDAFPESFKATGSSSLTVPLSAAGLYNTSEWQSYSRVKLDFEDATATAKEIEAECVTNIANESDNTIATLESALISVFGTNYVSQEKIILSGTINSADFEYLRTFKDIDMSDVKIVGQTASEDSTTDSAMALPSYAFCGSSSSTNIYLERIVLPKAVGQLNTYSLAYCPNLATIIFPKEMTVKTIQTYAFRGSAIKEIPGYTESIDGYLSSYDVDVEPKATGLVNFPRSFASYNTGAFRDALQLHTVDFSGFTSMTNIASSTFYGCTNLTSVKLPENQSIFTTINSQSFYGCVNLNNVVIPESVLYLGDRSFAGCSSLTSIDIPKMVSGASASLPTLNGVFNECTALVKVSVNWENPTVAGDGSAPVYTTAVPPAIVSATSGSNYSTFPDIFFTKSSGRYITVLEGTDDLYDDIAGWDDVNYFENSSANMLVVNAGGLESAVVAKYTDVKNIPATVAISGDMNAADFAALNTYTNITTLDLSGVTLKSGATSSNTATVLFAEAFKGNTNLQVVTLPDALTEIGSEAFCLCSALEIVVIPSGVTSVGDSAFYGCSSMPSVSLSTSVTSIGESAFENCSKMTTISLPQALTTIGANAFAGTGLTSVVMPDKVTEVADGLFKGCSALASITLSSATTSIGSYALRDCSEIVSFVVPTSVTTIGEGAFSGCSILSGVTFDSYSNTEGAPDLTLGANAFASCTSLKSFSLPTNVTTMGDNLFYGCSSLSTIKVYWTSSIPTVTNITFPTAFLTTEMAGKISLPAGATTETYAAVTGWSSYNLAAAEDNIVETTPGGLAIAIQTKWRDFLSKTTADYPSIVVTGSMNATDFEALQMVTQDEDGNYLDHSFKFVDLSGAVIQGNTITSMAFSGNTVIGEMLLPETITTIESEAFRDCSNLLTFEFPSALTTIGSYALSGTAISEVPQLRSLTTIGAYAFTGCPILTTVDLSQSKNLAFASGNTYIFYLCSALKSVSLPDHLTYLPDQTFNSCTSLTTIALPSSLEYLGYRAFQKCTSLETINIPASVTTFGSNSTQGCDQFDTCTALSSIYVNWESVDAIPAIKSDAFPSQFINSKYIYIPKTMSAADYQSASGWSSFQYEVGGLNEVTLSGGPLEYVLSGNWGSNWSESIPSELIINGVADYNEMKSGWAKLADGKGVKLGEVITSLDLSGLTEVKDSSDATNTNTIPAGFWEDNTGTFKLSSVVLPEIVTEIQDGTTGSTGAFRGLLALTSVTMPGVTKIGESAFENCYGMVTMELPSKIQSVGKYAFKGASKLTRVATPARLATESLDIDICQSAFENCTSLSDVELNLGVRSLDDDTFKNCQALTAISIPTSLTSFGGYPFTVGTVTTSPFTGCSSLSTIEVLWTVEPTNLSGFTDATFPGFESANTNGYTIVVPTTFTATVGGTWASYNLTTKSDDMVASTAGNLDTILTKMGNSLGSTLKLYGVMNSDDFAALQSRTFTEIDLRDVSVVGTITYEGTLFQIGDAIPTGAMSSNTSLVKLTLPRSIDKIGSSAFAGCTSLSTLISTAGITYLGSDAFNGCSALTLDDFSGLFSEVQTLKANALAGVGFTKLNLTTTLTTIEDGAFSGCNAESLTLPQSYTITSPTVSISALPSDYSIYGYKTINIVADDGSLLSASAEVAAFTELQLMDCGWDNYLFAADDSVSIDTTLIVTGEGDASDRYNNTLEALIAKKAAFYDFVSNPTKTYSKIIIKGNINQADFNSLKRFEEIDMSGATIVGTVAVSSTNSTTPTVVYSTKDTTYKGLNGSGVWTGAIPAAAFCNLADNVSADPQTSLGEQGFTSYALPGDANTTLKKITLPLSVQCIGVSAFANCTALQEVVFPEGMALYYIARNAFSYAGLTSFGDVPSTLDYVDQYCFSQCKSMLSADLSNASDDIIFGAYTFYQVSNMSSAAIPTGFHAAITANMYLECAALTSFKIPAATTSIGASAFKKNYLLQEIEIPATVSAIGDGAFYLCSVMTRVSLLWEGDTAPSITFSTTASACSFPSQFYKPDVDGSTSSDAYRMLVPDGANYTASGWENYLLQSNSYDTVTSTSDSGFSVPSAWTSSDTAPAVVYIKGTMKSSHFANLKSIASATIDMSGVTAVEESKSGAGDANTVCASAMAGNTNIVTLILPDCITAIGESAFDGCSKYTPGDMSSTVTTIGKRAYANTKVDSTLALSSSLTYIGSEAFDGCSILAIVAPWSTGYYAATIESDTFSADFLKDGGVLSITVPSTVDIDRYYNADRDGNATQWTLYNIVNEPSDSYSLTITAGGLDAALALVSGLEPKSNPIIISGVMNSDDLVRLAKGYENANGVYENFAYIDISGVRLSGTTGIASETFKGDTALTTLALPSTVSTIGSSAFEGCTSLKTVTWDATASSTSVGNSAFKGCTSLVSVEAILSNNLASVGESTFEGCTSLSELTLSETTTSYGAAAFEGCTRVVSIIAPTVSTAPEITATTFPEGFRTGGEYSITMPAGYLTAYEGSVWISSYNLETSTAAFDPETAILYVTCNSTALTTGYYYPYAVENPVPLADRDMQVQIDKLLAAEGVAYTFLGDTSKIYGKIVISGNINQGDIYDMKSRFKVIDMSNATIVGEVHTLYVTSSTETDGAGVITANNKTQTGNALPFNVFKDNTVIEEFIIAPGVTKLSVQGLYGATKLRKTNIPSGVTIVENRYVMGCTALTSVVFEGASVSTIEHQAFRNCTSLKVFDMPSSVTNINYQAFMGSAITSVELPEGLVTLGVTGTTRQQFADCEALDYVKINWTPDSTMPTFSSDNVSSDVFPSYYLSGGSKYLSLPSGYMSSDYADTSLALFNLLGEGEVIVETNTIVVDSDTEGAAASSYLVQTIADLKAEGQIGSAIILGSLNTADFAVINAAGFTAIDMSEATSLYKSGNDFGTNIQAIPTEAFKDNTALQSIVLPNGVFQINEDAFNGCTALREVTMPANSRTNVFVEDGAFEGCSNLSKVENSNYIRSIGAGAFAGTAITSISNNSNVDEFGNPSLDLSNLYSEADSKGDGIGLGAFAGCDQLSSVYFGWANATQLPKFGKNAVTGVVDILPDSFMYDASNMEQPYIRVLDGTKSLYADVIAAGYALLEASEDPTASVGLSEDGTVLTVMNVASSEEPFNTIEEASVYGNLYVAFIADRDWDNHSDLYASMKASSNLMQLVEDSKVDLTGVTKIVVSGNINAADYTWLRDKFSIIDLSRTTQVGYVLYQSTDKILECYTPRNAFYYDTVITAFYTPSNLIAIGFNTFEGASNLTKAELSSTVVNIMYGAFKFCSSFASINLSSTITAIGGQAFSGCTVLTNDGLAGLESVKVTTFQTQAFNNCDALTYIDVPASVTVINGSTYQSCDKVEWINIPATVTKFASTAKTFIGCNAATEIILNWASNATVTLDTDNLGELFPTQFLKTTADCYSLTVPDQECVDATTGVYAELKAYYNLKTADGGSTDPDPDVDPDPDPDVPVEATYDAGTNTVTVTNLNSTATQGGVATGAAPTEGNLAAAIEALETETTDAANATTLIVSGDMNQVDFYALTEKTYETIDLSGVTVVGYAEYKASTLDDNTIPYKAFYQNTSLKSIVLPDGVERIGQNVFCECTALASVDFPSSLGIIMYGAFTKTGLTSFTAPESLYEIQSISFQSCSSLTSVDLTTAPLLRIVADKAFLSCVNLDLIEIAWMVKEGVLYAADGVTAITSATALTSLSFPAQYLTTETTNPKIIRTTADVGSATAAEYYADTALASYSVKAASEFECTVTIDGTAMSVTDVASVGFDETYAATYGPYHIAYVDAKGVAEDTSDVITAMKANSGIYKAVQAAIDAGTITQAQVDAVTSITVTGDINPADLTYLYGKGATRDLSGTELVGYVNYQSTNVAEGYTPNKMFRYDTALTKIMLPSNIEVVGYYSFDNATNLATVQLATGTTKLMFFAFNNCSSLSTINLQSTIETIETSAFSGCTVLPTTGITTMTPETLSCSVFNNCDAFTELPFPSTVTELKGGTYSNCSNEALTSIDLPSKIVKFSVKSSSTTTLGTFLGCSNVTEFILNWDSDTTVTFPTGTVDGVTSNLYVDTIFPAQFLKDSDEGYSITVPDQACVDATTGVYAELAKHYNLKVADAGATDPDPDDGTPKAVYDATTSTITVTNLDSTATQGDVEATAVPTEGNLAGLISTLTTETAEAANATDIVISGDMNNADFAIFSTMEFVNVDLSDANIVGVCYSKYESSTNTNTTDSPAIPGRAFYEQTQLESCILPDGLALVGYNSFYGCSALTTVGETSPSSLTTILYGGFSGCKLLETDFVFTSSFKTFAGVALNGCAAITVADFSEVTSLIKFELSAMSGCSSVESIEVPASVTTMSNNVFKNCSSLTELKINWVVEDGAIQTEDGVAVTGISNSTFPKEYLKSATENVKYITIPDGQSVESYNTGDNSLGDLYNLAIADAGATDPDPDPSSVTVDGTTLTVTDVESAALTSAEAGTYGNLYVEFADAYKEDKTLTIKDDTDEAYEGLYDAMVGYSNLMKLVVDSEVDLTGVTKIVVSGNINAADYTWLRDKFSIIDLSGATQVGNVLYQSTTKIAEKYIPRYAFYADTTLTEFYTPSNVTALGYTSFDAASALQKVELGDDVTTILWASFRDCAALTDINLSSKIGTMGELVFSGCKLLPSSGIGLEDLTLSSFTHQMFLNCDAFTEFVIPSTVKSLVGGTFQNCDGVTKIDLPATVVTIANKYSEGKVANAAATFLGCNNVTEIKLNWAANASVTLDVVGTDKNDAAVDATGQIFPAQFLKDSDEGYSITIPAGCKPDVSDTTSIYGILAQYYSLVEEAAE